MKHFVTLQDPTPTVSEARQHLEESVAAAAAAAAAATTQQQHQHVGGQVG